MHVGKYEIRGLLGRGGMGAVYKAAMPVTGRMVALKVCRPTEILEDIMGMENIRRAFLREAVTMARIRHPNVTGIFDVSEGDEAVPPHFAMEYYCNNLGLLMGETYEMEAPSRRLGVEASLSIARQMLMGLDRLHYAGIVHRDVKPFNVMLAEGPEGRDEVRLIDFGLSKLRGETLTRHKGMVVGSPYYTAPEQEDDPEQADARADLFSVGVTLFRMLTGLLPNEGDRTTRISHSHPDLDQGWDGFFASALAHDRTRRFADAGAMLAALDELADAWAERRDEVCSYFDPDQVPRHHAGEKPRVEPRKVRPADARETFGLDELWRPATYGYGRFEDAGDVVQDTGSGLFWEKAGTRYPVEYEDALAHVQRLNEQAFAGRTDWRLPTVDELTTVFTGSTEPGAFCLETVFDPGRSRLWSSDEKSFTASWYADARMGFVGHADRTCFLHARAVAG